MMSGLSQLGLSDSKFITESQCYKLQVGGLEEVGREGVIKDPTLWEMMDLAFEA